MSNKRTEKFSPSKSFTFDITASSVTAFTLGILSKEVYTFISEGGLSGDYPLSKSLFVMILCMLTLAVLSIPRFLEMEKTVNVLKREPQDPNGSRSELNHK